MSQDQITSSEESDFNNDKISNIESVPTSPENNTEKILKKKVISTSDKSSTPINNISHIEESPDPSDLMDESPDGPTTPSSTTSTPSQTPKSKDDGSDSKLSKSEKKDKKEREKEKREKKEKKSQRAINFASGVSTSVPLTGDRPKPDNHVSMDDDVLLAIFIILFENDPGSQGMTVKQICDVLVEKHPDMSKLSSKTSNLVSAKLNAYVKKVEKGDSSIHYSLSRDWADSSPKRMVYVYRGILSPEYPSYVQNIIEELRKKDAMNSHSIDSVSDNMSIDQIDVDSDSNTPAVPKPKSNKTNDAVSSAKANRSESPLAQDLSSVKSISPAGLQLDKSSPFGNGSIDFGIPQLSVPYSVAPVTASLNISMPMQDIDSNKTNNNDNELNVDNKKHNNAIKSEFSIGGRSNQYLTAIPDSDDEEESYNSLRVDFDEEDDDTDVSVYENHGYYRRGSDMVTERIPSGIGKRSKSISFVNKRTKSAYLISNQESQQRQNSTSSVSQIPTNLSSKKIITAAAVTPRVPRKSFANTPNAAAAVAALRAVVLGSYSGTINDSVSAITSSIMTDTSVEPSISAKWLETVRSGFLNQEIDSPEDVSLAELETLFA